MIEDPSQKIGRPRQIYTRLPAAGPYHRRQARLSAVTAPRNESGLGKPGPFSAVRGCERFRARYGCRRSRTSPPSTASAALAAGVASCPAHLLQGVPLGADLGGAEHRVVQAQTRWRRAGFSPVQASWINSGAMARPAATLNSVIHFVAARCV